MVERELGIVSKNGSPHLSAIVLVVSCLAFFSFHHSSLVVHSLTVVEIMLLCESDMIKTSCDLNSRYHSY